jgi:hypothetical protein
MRKPKVFPIVHELIGIIGNSVVSFRVAEEFVPLVEQWRGWYDKMAECDYKSGPAYTPEEIQTQYDIHKERCEYSKQKELIQEELFGLGFTMPDGWHKSSWQLCTQYTSPHNIVMNMTYLKNERVELTEYAKGLPTKFRKEFLKNLPPKRVKVLYL